MINLGKTYYVNYHFKTDCNGLEKFSADLHFRKRLLN